MIAGNTRHQSSVALILIDVINRFEFPNGDRILENALPTAEKLAMHSAFFQTPLEILLRYLGASSLILVDWRLIAASSVRRTTRTCAISGYTCRPTVAPHGPAANTGKPSNTLRTWQTLESWHLPRVASPI